MPVEKAHLFECEIGNANFASSAQGGCPEKCISFFRAWRNLEDLLKQVLPDSHVRFQYKFKNGVIVDAAIFLMKNS
ncbi:MAG: hypothetical protein KJ893_05450 [Candidatus Omnitrophica bacterium]|nr:hypothetical protein [Candidatus Omnitrophota bacterium]MBU4479031.1 hypothetical protein [Candidatus Omnitrophota bacterium]MCG2703049.1 hypothetical protein [Candidatus Omnitrophota bacterium]